MVCEWGMNKTLGPLALGGDDDHVFLGKEFSRSRHLSEQTSRPIDQEIRDLVVEAEAQATALLKANEARLHELARALLEYEVLDSREIDRLLAGQPARVPERDKIPEGEMVPERDRILEEDKGIDQAQAPPA
jgi:cell division protease FtsH